MEFDEILKRHFIELRNKPNVCGQFLEMSTKEINLFMKILYWPSNKMIPKEIANGNNTAANVKNAFKILEKLQLGQCEDYVGDNRLPTIQFVRVSADFIKNNPHVGLEISNMGIKLPELIDVLEIHDLNGERDDELNLETESQSLEQLARKSALNLTEPRKSTTTRKMTRNSITSDRELTFKKRIQKYFVLFFPN